ncbi:hypothetical protein ONZ45_g14908 [Pleurotus djamor]|nr:hypothetical protein ONZ45_g14908 [Pleurotus djamor]
MTLQLQHAKLRSPFPVLSDKQNYALKDEYLKLAACLPALPGYNKACLPRKNLLYLPPRWVYGFECSPAQSLEAIELRGASEGKTIMPEEEFRQLGTEEALIAPQQVFFAEQDVCQIISDIVGDEYNIQYATGWVDGKEVRLLVLADTWRIVAHPDEDEMKQITDFLYGDGEAKVPKWYIDKDK